MLVGFMLDFLDFGSVEFCFVRSGLVWSVFIVYSGDHIKVWFHTGGFQCHFSILLFVFPFIYLFF